MVREQKISAQFSHEGGKETHQVRICRACSSTDRAPGFEPVGWEFESPRARCFLDGREWGAM